MSRAGIRRWAKAAAILTFAAAVTGTAVSRHVPAQQPPLLLSLEFADSPQQVRQLAGDLRDAVMRAQRADSWLFIPSYWALFASCGMVIARSEGSRNRAIGFAVIAAITGAAALDYVENAAIAAALERPADQAWPPFPWAIGKWLLLFSTSALIAIALGLQRRWRPHAVLTAALLGIAGLFGAIATIFAPALVQQAVGVMAAGLLLLALLWIWSPDYLTDRS